MIEVTIDEPYDYSVDAEPLAAIVREALAAENAGEVDVSVLVTDEETVRELNRRHRGLDETTDVLSFGMEELVGGEFKLPPGLPRQLGEVVIAYEQAERQAAEFGHGLPEELKLLTVHGLLHLLGYDHATEGDRARMSEREHAILGAHSLIDRAT